jgi:uncharacterized protein
MLNRDRPQSVRRVLLAAAALLLMLFSASGLAALDVPRLQGRVNDYGGMISATTETRLDVLLRQLEESDSTQVVVLTVPSLKGEPLEAYALKVAETWGIGQKEYDNGALLLVSRNDRLVRIEVGYGLEGRLTDLLAGRIVDYAILPNFKAGRIDQGFVDGVEAIIEAVRGEYTGSGQTAVQPVTRSSRGGFLPFFILIMIISLLGSRRRVFGGLAGAVFLPLLILLVFPFSLPLLLLMIPFGFAGGLLLPGFLLFSGLGGFGPRRYTRGGFGGFSGGGGGGFGGFSGGGGGFGGGGASGGW